MIKVINLFGSPGCGKSTTASGLFYYMKSCGMSVELVSEYAKDCMHEGRISLLQEDQLYIFTQQHRKLFRIRDTYDYAIMDSPLVLSSLYLQDDSFYDKEIFNKLVFSTFNKYDNINFFVRINTHFKFEETGRKHNLNDSIQLEEKLENMLNYYGINYSNHINNHYLLEEILDKIKNNS